MPDPASGSSLFRKARALIARALLVLGFLVVFSLVFSRIATDCWLFTQFMYWIPSWVYLALGVPIILCERLIALPSLRPRWKTPSWWLLIFCAACALQIACRHLDRPAPAAVNPSHLTIVQWNMSSPDMLNFDGTLAELRSCRESDVILLGVTVPDAQLRRMVEGLGKEWTLRRSGVFAVASRYPIDHMNSYALGLEFTRGRSASPAFQEFYNLQVADRFHISRREFNLPDPGYVLDIQLHAPIGPVTIRMLDLPSNPFRSRMEIASSAAGRIHDLVRAGNIAMDPDFIIGDCNIPAGSASLSLLSESLIHAQSLAATGDFRPTWPRALPFLRIDHAWVRPGSKVVNYRTFDAGISDHRGQSLTLEYAPPLPAR